MIGTPHATRPLPPAVATTNSRRQRRRRPLNCMHALVLSLQRHELSIQGGKKDCFLNAATSSSSSRPVGPLARQRLAVPGRQYHPVPVSFSLEMGGVSQLDSNFPICKLCSAYHPHKRRDGSPLSGETEKWLGYDPNDMNFLIFD